MPTTIQFGNSGWSAVSEGKFARPSQPNGPVPEDRVLPDYEAPLDFNDIGELINENQIVINSKGSARLSIKGHHPEKDGIFACLLAAQAFTARCASLTQSPVRGGFSSSHLRGIRIG